MAAGKPGNGNAGDRPNVVIIYGDDVGFGDVGAYGAKLIPTPNIDELASQGLRFTDAHCAAATCTPSRYSLLTGEMAFRKPGTGIAPGTANMIIGTDQYTLGDLFQQAGYRTGVIGKWHLGLGDKEIDWNGQIKPGPEAIGFDHYFIFPATNDRTPCVYIENGRVVNLDPADPITVSRRKRIPDSVPGTKYPDGRLDPNAITVYKGDGAHSATVINGIGRIGYMKGGKAALFKDETIADVFVAQAKKFIAASKDKPFFLFFSASDIHAPRWPHQRFRGKSRSGLRGDAMVSFDWSAGAIVEALKEHGLLDNTIVIVSSDNGPVYVDGRYQDGSDAYQVKGTKDYHPAAGIYRGGKYQIYEGGTRVPFIVRWPGKIRPGVSSALFSQVDLLASLAALLGKDVPAGHAQDSRNCLAALLGADTKGPEVILEQAKGVAIRHRQWKYLENTEQLYDMSVDPSETKDLSAAFPEVASKLKQTLQECKKTPLAAQDIGRLQSRVKGRPAG